MCLNVYANLTHVLYLLYGSCARRTLENNMNFVDYLFNPIGETSNKPPLEWPMFGLGLDLCLNLSTNMFGLVWLVDVFDLLYKLLYVILSLLFMPVLEASRPGREPEHVLYF